jgi:carbon monoxide dehydrogenase subunit G
MPRLHETIDTALPLEAAFAFVADFANASRWDPGVATSERIDDGPVDVGARYRLGIRTRGRVTPMEYRVTAFEPARRVVLAGSGSGIDAVDEIRFEPGADGTGTHIDYTAEIRLLGWMRLVQPFVGGTFDRIAKDALGGMQRSLDTLAAAGER